MKGAQKNICCAILDGLNEPIVFVDTHHIIRYMNAQAAAQYQKKGGYALLGRNVLDCHNASSHKKIMEVFARMRSGADEEAIYQQPGRIVYMRAVRDPEGKLLGYYERYEKIR